MAFLLRNKKKKTKPFCTLVVAPLSSSNQTKKKGRFTSRFAKKKGYLVYGQNGVDLSFSPCFALWVPRRCSQVLVFTSIWGTEKGVWQWHFSCCFSQHLALLGPPSTAKQEKTQNDKSTLLYPPPTCIPLCEFWVFSLERPKHFSQKSVRIRFFFTVLWAPGKTLRILEKIREKLKGNN